ncbi:MAG: hypothetical protein SNJ75_08760, partial [Gemmataceae bacterium]
HSRGILHRDIKPANVLIRIGSGQVEVRLIDFGLALKHERLGAASSRLQSGKSLIGTEIAGTLGYAAPEQLGQLPGVKVGPRADIYGFGRTLSFAMFGHPEPTLSDYKRLPEQLADLLDRCLQANPERRPVGFDEILRALQMRASRPVAEARLAEPVPAVPRVKPVLLEEVRTEPLQALPVEQRPERREAPYPEGNETQRINWRRPRPHTQQDQEYDDTPRHRIGTTTSVRLLTAVMAWIFGFLGVHKFMQGNSSAGVIRILISLTCIGLYVTIWVAFLERIIYLFRSNESYEEVYIRKQQWWF